MPTPDPKQSDAGRVSKGSPSRPFSDNVRDRLAAIPELSRSDLVAQWAEAYGRPPPKGLSRRLLEYAAAYHIQVQAFGGLSPAARRKLQKLAAARDEKQTSKWNSSKESELPPGSRLVREWRGRTYTVDVLEKGFRCDGKHYRSLSEIARAITGARWSGPRYFGI